MAENLYRVNFADGSSVDVDKNYLATNAGKLNQEYAGKYEIIDLSNPEAIMSATDGRHYRVNFEDGSSKDVSTSDLVAGYDDLQKNFKGKHSVQTVYNNVDDIIGKQSSVPANTEFNGPELPTETYYWVNDNGEDKTLTSREYEAKMKALSNGASNSISSLAEARRKGFIVKGAKRDDDGQIRAEIDENKRLWLNPLEDKEGYYTVSDGNGEGEIGWNADKIGEGLDLPKAPEDTKRRISAEEFFNHPEKYAKSNVQRVFKGKEAYDVTEGEKWQMLMNKFLEVDPFVKEYEAKMDRMRFYASVGNDVVNPETITPEETERYRALKADRDALGKLIDSNPAYQAYKREQRARIKGENEEFERLARKSNDDWYESEEGKKALFEMGKAGYLPESADAALYKAAIRANEDAYNVYNRNGKYSEGGFMKSVGEGIADWATDPSTWTFNIVDIFDNLQAKDLYGRLNDSNIAVNNETLSSEQVDKILSPAEKAFLISFFNKGLAESGESWNLANGYQAGQTAADSLLFMAEFLLSGSVAGGIKGGIKAGVNAIAKNEGKNSVTRAARSLANWARKEMAIANGLEKVGGKAVSKAHTLLSKELIGGIERGFNTVLQTGLMPSTFNTITQNMAQVDEDGMLVDQHKAIRDGIHDSLIETYSEQFGEVLDQFGIGGFPLEKYLKATPTGKMLRNAGWNGYLGEMLEEVVGAGIRQVTGLDDTAWSQFWDWDNLAVMAASFLPMTIFGTAAQLGQYKYRKSRYEDALAAMKEGANEDQLKWLAKVEEGIMNTPLNELFSNKNEAFRQMMKEHGHDEEFSNKVTEYIIAAGGYKAFLQLDEEKQKEQRDEMLKKLNERIGQPFTRKQTDEWGNENDIVDRVYVQDKGEAFVKSEAENGDLAVILRDPKNGEKREIIVSQKDLMTDGNGDVVREKVGLDNFLRGEQVRTKSFQQQQRMAREYQDHLKAMQSRFTEGAEVEHKPTSDEEGVKGKVSAVGNNGVTIKYDSEVTINGETSKEHTLSWQQLAKEVNMRFAPMNDEEADSYHAHATARKARMRREINLAGREKEITYKGKTYQLVAAIPHGTDTENDGKIHCVLRDLSNNKEQVEMNIAFTNLAKQLGVSQRGYKMMTLSDYEGNENAFKEDAPESWAFQNNLKKQDGGRDTVQQLNASVIAQRNIIQATSDALAVETDADIRKSLEDRRTAAIDRLAILDDVLAQYKRRDEQSYLDALQIDLDSLKEEQREENSAVASRKATIENLTALGLSAEEVTGNVQANLDEAKKALAEVEKSRPQMGTDAAAYMEEKKAFADRLLEAQQKVAEWETIKSVLDLQKRDEEHRTEEALEKLAERVEAVAKKTGREVPTTIVTMANFREVMKSLNIEEKEIQSVANMVKEIQEARWTGLQIAVNGLQSGNNVLIFAEFNDVDEVLERTYKHETQHQRNKAEDDIALTNAIAVAGEELKPIVLKYGKNEEELTKELKEAGASEDTINAIKGELGKSLTARIAAVVSDKDKLEAIVVKMSGASVNPYMGKDLAYLADEFSAFALEDSTKEGVNEARMKKAGASEELIKVIKEEYGKQNGNYWNDARSLALNNDNSGSTGRENVTNPSVTAEAVAEQGLRPAEGSEDADAEIERLFNGDAEALEEDGEIIAENSDGATRFSVTTWEKGGREKLAAYLYKNYSKEEADNFLESIDALAKQAKEFADGTPGSLFSQWCVEEVRLKDGTTTPLLRALKSNSDYGLNIDFSTVCKKRQVIDHLMNKMISEGDLEKENLTPADIARINQIIQKHGLEIACGICFVDARRYNAFTFANNFLDKYNPIVQSLRPGAEIAGYNYAGNEKFSNEGKEDLTKVTEVVDWEDIFGGKAKNPKNLNNYELDWKGVCDLFIRDRVDSKGKPKKSVVETARAEYASKKMVGGKANPRRKTFDECIKSACSSAEEKMAYAISKNPHLRMLAKAEDFVASKGWEAVLAQNSELETLWNVQKGAAGARANESATPYDNEVLDKGVSGDIYDIAGYRMQSFSDFVGRMYFDYLQAFADLAAMQLPGHAYTKEPSFVKLFGMMGMKINMSLIAAVDNRVEKEYAGLRLKPGKKGDSLNDYEYNWNTTVRNENGEIVRQGQTFDPVIAAMLQDDPRYTKNAGTIAVGISPMHIRKMLADKNIRMVIPYHKSGLPHIVSVIYDLNEIYNYEPFQNTRKLDENGKPKGLTKEEKATREAPFNFILHQMSIAENLEASYVAMKKLFVTAAKCDSKNTWKKQYDALYAEAVASGEKADIALGGKYGEEGFLPKVAADLYIANCKANEWLPKFDEFTDEYGYFKTLIDFSVYDAEGNYTQQEAIHFEVPSNVGEYIQETLAEDQQINDDELAKTDAINNEVKAYLANKELRSAQEAIAEKDNYSEADLKLLSPETIYNVGDARNTPAEKKNSEKTGADWLAQTKMSITPEVRDEMQQIEALARLDGNYLKAPNGADTKLNPEQWALVRTKNFKQWFGDWENDPENASKVVDENGEPMVVYHGTKQTFTEFKKNIGKRWVVGLELPVESQGYFFSESREDAEGYGYNVMPVFLNSRSIADLSDHNGNLYEDLTGYNPWDYAGGADSWWDILDDEKFEEAVSSGMDKEGTKTVERAKALGYDAIKFRESSVYDDEKITSIAVFSPSQIKSATDNNGEYSRENDDIRFSVQFTPAEIGSMRTPILTSKGTFNSFADASKWIKDNLYGKKYTNQFTREEVELGSKALEEIFQEKFTKKVGIPQHLAAVMSIQDFIETGIPAEVHPDTHGRGFDVIRLYNAFEYDESVYRVKSTIRRVRQGDKYYTYELQEMDLTEESPASGKGEGLSPSNPNSSVKSITGAKLLKGVKKTNSDEEILRPIPTEQVEKGIIIKTSKEEPFTEWILNGEKTVETQEGINALGSLAGKRVAILEATGKGNPTVVGYVNVDNEILEWDSPEAFHTPESEAMHKVKVGSPYDIKKKKYGYKLSNPVREENPYQASHSSAGRILNARVDDDGVLRFSVSNAVTPQQDADYRKAYEEGDVETAQRMVDEAAKAAGYTIQTFHGSPKTDIKKFKKGKHGYLGPGIYLADTDEFAMRYARKMGDGKLYELYAKVGNPLIVTSSEPAREILKETTGKESTYDKRKDKQSNESWLITSADIKKLEAKGYDSIVWDYAGEKEISVFNPNQVKSADPFTFDNEGNLIPLSERFNSESNDIRFSVANDNQKVFISNAAAAVESINMGKASGENWLKAMQGKGGLKAGEDKWLGLSDFLSDKKSVTKEELLNYINEHKIVIEESKYFDFGDIEDADPYELREYNSEHATEDKKAIDPTRLKYTTQGLENKREIALTVPTIEPYNDTDRVHFGDAGEGRTIAWSRFGDATDADGNRVLVIDEIQSKRHQDGREKGYRDNDKIRALVLEKRELKEESRNIVNGILHRNGFRSYDEEESVGIWEPDNYYKAWNGLLGKKEEQDKIKENSSKINRLSMEIEAERQFVPDAPFAKNWHELSMKRMLRLAAEEGYDKVAWTNGDMQAERYDIGQVVNSIDVQEWSDSSEYAFDVKTPKVRLVILNQKGGESSDLWIDEDGLVVSSDYIPEAVGKHISEVLGKGIADKIMTSGETTIEGDGLRVGGEGMKGFYDDILPRFMNKYGKKWGVKVGDIYLPSLENAEGWHSVDVTPEMKESVMNGQVMFSVANRNQQVGEKEVKNVIINTKKTDLPTNRKAAIECVASMKKPFINKDQDKEIKVSNTAIRHTGTQDSQHQRIDVRCIGVIDRIIENAVKIGNIPVAEDEKETTNLIEVYYCPVKLDESQYSVRMLVKQYKNRGAVIEDFQMYDMASKQKESDVSSRGTGNESLTPSLTSDSFYKVKVLIHNTQEEDKRLVGIEGQKTSFSVTEQTLNKVDEEGLKTVLGENAEDTLMTIYDKMPGEVKNAASDWFLKHDEGTLTDGLLNAIASMAKRDNLSEEETSALEEAASILGKELGVQLFPNDVLWIAYNEAHRGDESLKDRIANIAVARELGHATEYKQGSITMSEFLEKAMEEKDELIKQYRMMSLANATLNNLFEAMQNGSMSVENAAERDVRGAVARRKEYDRETVGKIVSLVRMLLRSRLIDNQGRAEVEHILGVIRQASAMRDITPKIKRLYDIMQDNQLRRARKTYNELLNKKAKKLDTKGVEKQGALDVAGQRVIDTYKAHIGDSLESIQAAYDKTIEDSMNDNLTETQRRNVESDFIALRLALDFRNKITASEAEERDMLAEMAEKEETMDEKAFKAYEKSVKEAIVENKNERIADYINLVQRLIDIEEASHSKAVDFLNNDRERMREIFHNANSDMEGINAPIYTQKSTFAQDVVNRAPFRIVFAPMATFDQMLRFFGGKSVNGEGYLYNRFMRGWLDATSNEYKGVRDAFNELDTKVSEVFGKEMKWSDLYDVEKRMPNYPIILEDGDRKTEIELTPGEALYVVMVSRMADGRMKLEAMGIEESLVENLRNSLDPRFIQLADFIQDEFLPAKREGYNEVHERLFGASMAAIENYFPLKINPKARKEKVDLSNPIAQPGTPSTITGNIIKRTRNALPLDLTTDAFSLVIEHIQQMEHWKAFAEFNRDLGDLLSYKHFENQVTSMASIYGGGDELWKNFKKVCQIASGSYHNDGGEDKWARQMAKGVSTAKISLRMFTAFKQLLSFPAYFAEANPIYLAEAIAKAPKCWNWAFENIPLYAKRLTSRQSGDHILSESEDWRSKFIENAARIGMTPNAAVDALTVSIGTYAIYKTRLDRYIRDGYPKATAEKKALEDATILYNETQQSNEHAFLSPLQMDRTFMSSALTIFRNSSMGYERQLIDAIRNTEHRMRKGYKAESIGFMAKQMERDGLSHEDAVRAATRLYNRQFAKDIVRIVLFGYGMQFAWNLGSYLPYLILGDDDDEKAAMINDVALHAMFGSVEGLSCGNVVSDTMKAIVAGESLQNFDPHLMPIVSDVINLVKKFDKDINGSMVDLVNIAAQMYTGVNPQTITDMVVAVVDACNGDFGAAKELEFLMLRILQVPQSQLDKLYLDEIKATALDAKKMTIEELAQRYAQYKMRRGTAWAIPFYSDQGEREAEEKYIEQFEKKAKERINIDMAQNYNELENEAKDMMRRFNSLNRRAESGDKAAEMERREIVSSPEYANLKLFMERSKEIDDQLNMAMRSTTIDEMANRINRMNELKSDAYETFVTGEPNHFELRYIQYAKGIVPEMTKIDDRYKNEYLKNHPEFLKAESEYLDALENGTGVKDEEKIKELAEVSAELTKEEKIYEGMKKPNGRGHYGFAKPTEKKIKELKARKKELNAEIKSGDLKKKADSIKKSIEGYVPEDIYNAEDFQIYLTMKYDPEVKTYVKKLNEVNKALADVDKYDLDRDTQKLMDERRKWERVIAQQIARVMNRVTEDED